jgi:hypothetical protein
MRRKDLPRGQRRQHLLRARIRTKSGRKSKAKTENLLALVNSGFRQKKEMDM